VTELPAIATIRFAAAGGAQMWKEEEHGQQRVSENRFREAMATGQATLAVAVRSA
jgi:Fe-S oxidoreductase